MTCFRFRYSRSFLEVPFFEGVADPFEKIRPDVFSKAIVPVSVEIDASFSNVPETSMNGCGNPCFSFPVGLVIRAPKEEGFLTIRIGSFLSIFKGLICPYKLE